MLHTKYQGSRPSSFREEELWRWSTLFLCSNLWAPGQGQFWPKEHHMNKLGRGAQGDAIYQIWKHLALQFFQRRRILKFSFFVCMFQLVTPLDGASFDPRGIQWTNLVEVHRRCQMPNIKAQVVTVWDNMIFKNFLLYLYVKSKPQQHGLISTSGP